MIAWLAREVARWPRFWALALVVAVAALAYANTLDAPFHFDDSHHIVANPYLRDAKYAAQFAHRPDMFSALPGHDMYRPMVLWSFAFNYRQGGYDPLAWRLTAIALHALCAVGVYLTYLVLAGAFAGDTARKPWFGALAAALLFAVHPVFTESVDYASARSSLLATLGVTWAFLLHHAAGRRRAGPARVALWLAAALMLTVGLLSKEIAVVFPVLLIWAAFLHRRRRWTGIAAVAPYLVVLAAYLVLRRELLGKIAIDFSAHQANFARWKSDLGASRSIWWNLFTQARVIAAYAGLFLLPVGLCVHRWVRVSRTPWEPGVLGGTALIAGMLALAWRLRRRQPMISLGLVWFLVALAPTSSIIPLNQVMNEHRLYLPGVGMVLASGAVLEMLRARARLPVARLLAPALLVLLALTWHRNLDWNDRVRLWQSAVDVSPRSDGAWNSLGNQLRGRGDYAAAERAFARALELDPRSWNAAFNTGTLYLERGRREHDAALLEQAARWLERSLEIRPRAERSRWFLAEVAFAQGRWREAERRFRELAGLRPRLYEMTRYPLAGIARERGDLERARSLYEEALRIGTDPVAARLGLARLALDASNRREAARQARTAMEQRPHSPRPWLFWASMHKGTPEAVHALFEAERRGYRPSAVLRADLFGGGAP